MDAMKNNASECKLIPCIVCNMYMLASIEEYMQLEREQLPKGVEHSEYVEMKCLNCFEKDQLLLQINNLQAQVDYLTERVSSLRNIREGESIIDQSMNEMVNKYDSLQVSGNGTIADKSNSLLIDSCFKNITIPNSIGSMIDGNKSLCSNDTSIWADEGSSTFDEVPHGLQMTPNVNILDTTTDISYSYLNGSVTDTSKTSFVNTLSIDLTRSSAKDSVNNATNADAVLSPKDVIVKTNSKAGDLPKNYIFNDVEMDKKAITMLAGDDLISKVSLVQADNKDTCSKYVKRGATVLNTLDTVLYLAKHRHLNLKNVMLHVGKNDVCNTNTETIKEGFKKFATAMLSLGVKFMISGPVPLQGLKSEQFSRLLNLNGWLQKWTKKNDLIFVDNFDLFWQKNHLFTLTKKGFIVNDLGVMILTHSMRTGYSSL